MAGKNQFPPAAGRDSRGSAQDDVVYEDLIPCHPDPLDELGEECAGTADEGQALAVLPRQGPRQRTSGRHRRCPHRRQPGCASRTAGSVRRPKPGCRPRPVPGGESRRRSVPPAAPGGPLRGALSLEALLRAPDPCPACPPFGGAGWASSDAGPARRSSKPGALRPPHAGHRTADSNSAYVRSDQLLEALVAGLTDELVDRHTPMVVRPDDHSGRNAVRKYGPFDRLGGRRASLYLPQAATRTPGWARTQHRNLTSHLVYSHDRLVSPMRELERDSLPSP